MRGYAEFGRPMHLVRADLQLDRLALRTDDGCMKGLVHVEFRHRDEVLEPAGHWAPSGMDDTERAVAVANTVDKNPHSDEIVDVGKIPTADDHLLVHGVVVLRPTRDVRLHLALAEIRVDLIEHRGEVLIA